MSSVKHPSKNHIIAKQPTILVILGVTGDLMSKKIAPALFNLFRERYLPKSFKIIGFSRRDWTSNDLKFHISEILAKRGIKTKSEEVKKFLELFSYAQGQFGERSGYNHLKKALDAVDDKWGTCSNKLFYLSVPPQFYRVILSHLSASHLTDPCSPEEGWTRVLVEKPFGDDEKSARALDALLGKLFKEVQIYRIDHYLAKETFQNVLAFRFSNNLFENDWGRDLIEKIYVREFENIGVEDRGVFYDKVGALRDVGQNHLLEMVALATMDQPRDLSEDAIRESRVAILKTLKPLSFEEAKNVTFRAQYKGYRSIKGVARNSQTETYFRVRGSLSHPRWEGVPIIMEAGKRLIDPAKKQEITEIEIVFRHPAPCLCPPGKHYKNSLVFRQDPKEGITIRFWSKKQGFAMELEERVFSFDLRKTSRKSQYTEEYEKLLLDCIDGDQTLFVSSGEVAAMWRFVDPIISAWQKGAVPLRSYIPDSPTIAAEAKTSDDVASVHSIAQKEIAVVGLGKMGRGVALRLREKGWRVLGYNRHAEAAKELEKDGIESVSSLSDISSKLKKPRIFWIMITAGAGVDEIIFGKNGLAKHLEKGDIVIDSGNSFYEDSMRRAKKLARSGVVFMDVGFSGGPKGARNGGSLMIGGDKKTFGKIEELFKDLSVPEGYRYFGAAGAGHFVKMMHNGIEYGMMQALAEGFAVMKKSPFQLDLEKVADVYNRGSVIESRLVSWLMSAYKQYGEALNEMSGSVAHTGEGEWTVRTARKFKVPTPIIKGAFDFRVRSKRAPSYIGKILTALRNQFGGHSLK